MKMHSVLVLTTYCDELQLEDQKSMLDKQTNVILDHIIIGGLSKVQSQLELHKIAVDNSLEYDYILKLDADMVPLHNDSIETLCNFASARELQRLTTPVLDFFIGESLMGVHLIRASSVPKESCITNSNTDGWIGNIEGISISKTSRIFFSHGYNPSISQSLRFGLHRGLKAKNGGSVHGHWQTLYKLFQNRVINQSSPDLSIAVIGSLKGLEILTQENKYWDLLDHDGDEFISLYEYAESELKKDFPSLKSFDSKTIWEIHFSIFNSRSAIIGLILNLIYNKVYDNISFYINGRNLK
jgi:hypothetical protein